MIYVDNNIFILDINFNSPILSKIISIKIKFIRKIEKKLAIALSIVNISL